MLRGVEDYFVLGLFVVDMVRVDFIVMNVDCESRSVVKVPKN